MKYIFAQKQDLCQICAGFPEIFLPTSIRIGDAKKLQLKETWGFRWTAKEWDKNQKGDKKVNKKS